MRCFPQIISVFREFWNFTSLVVRERSGYWKASGFILLLYFNQIREATIARSFYLMFFFSSSQIYRIVGIIIYCKKNSLNEKSELSPFISFLFVVVLVEDDMWSWICCNSVGFGPGPGKPICRRLQQLVPLPSSPPTMP